MKRCSREEFSHYFCEPFPVEAAVGKVNHGLVEVYRVTSSGSDSVDLQEDQGCCDCGALVAVEIGLSLSDVEGVGCRTSSKRSPPR